MTTPGNQTELAHTTANLGFSSFNGIPLVKLIAEHGMEFGMKCGASPLRGLAALAVSFLIPSRLHIGLAVFICSLHGVDRTCICCSLWVLFILLRLFSETVCWHPLQFGVSKTISSGFIITSELNVDHFNTEYLVHLGIFQQTVKNECESKTFKHGSRGSRQPHRTSLVAYSFPA